MLQLFQSLDCLLQSSFHFKLFNLSSISFNPLGTVEDLSLALEPASSIKSIALSGKNLI